MTANDLKLYHSAASPNSRRVRIFLAEKGLKVPYEQVDIAMIVVIRRHHRHRATQAVPDARLIRDVRERSIAVVSQQPHAVA